MGINETQYRIDIEALQGALAMINSAPRARLEIEQHRAQLTISGEYAWNVHGVQEIAKVLERTGERFFNRNDADPVDPTIDMDNARPGQLVTVTVRAKGVYNYTGVQHWRQESQDAIKSLITQYLSNGHFTIAFDLDGGTPYLLRNSEAPAP